MLSKNLLLIWNKRSQLLWCKLNLFDFVRCCEENELVSLTLKHNCTLSSGETAPIVKILRSRKVRSSIQNTRCLSYEDKYIVMWIIWCLTLRQTILSFRRNTKNGENYSTKSYHFFSFFTYLLFGDTLPNCLDFQRAICRVWFQWNSN